MCEIVIRKMHQPQWFQYTMGSLGFGVCHRLSDPPSSVRYAGLGRTAVDFRGLGELHAIDPACVKKCWCPTDDVVRNGYRVQGLG